MNDEATGPARAPHTSFSQLDAYKREERGSTPEHDDR